LTLAKHGVITLLAAINPYEEARQRLQAKSDFVKTVFIDCPLSVVRQRDTKGLYQRAYLPPTDSRYVAHFTGVSDPFEPPLQPDFQVQTHEKTIEQATEGLVDFILSQLRPETRSIPLPKALFIGRWQPFHNGHKWLIDNKLEEKIPVLIAVRDLPCDAQNPFTTEQTIAMIRKVYLGQSVEVMRISDIESVNYGRGVGYKVQMFEPPTSIYNISATAIRQAVVEGRDDWKNWVDSSIHNLIQYALCNE
jgi:adenylylsulfate kinase